MKTRVSFLVLCGLLAPTLGCDSGYRYRRSGKEHPDGHNIARVRCEMEEFTILSGSSAMTLGLHVANNSTQDVSVVGATVSTQGRVVATDKAIDNRKIVSPGQADTIWILCPLGEDKGERASNVLGAKIAVNWVVRVGKDDHKIEFEFER